MPIWQRELDQSNFGKLSPARDMQWTNLISNMVPVVLAANFLKVLLEQGAHGDDAIGHSFDLAEPLLIQLGVVEDLGGDTSAVNGGIGVERSDEYLNLRVDPLLFFCILTDDREGADALSVKTLTLVSIIESL